MFLCQKVHFCPYFHFICPYLLAKCASEIQKCSVKVEIIVYFRIPGAHFANKYGHIKWKYGQKWTFWHKNIFYGVRHARSMEKIWPKNEKFWNIFWYYWLLCLSLFAHQISSKSVKNWPCKSPFLKGPQVDFFKTHYFELPHAWVN